MRKKSFHFLKCAIQRWSSFLIKTCASTFRARCSEGYRTSERTLPPSRIDLHVLISTGEQEERRSWDEKTQQEIVLPVEHVRTSLGLGIVLRIGPSSYRAIRHPPIRPRIHLVHDVYPLLDTPPSIRCFQLELLVAERNDGGTPGFRRRTT